MIKRLLTASLALFSFGALGVMFLKSSSGGGAWTPASETCFVSWYESDDISTLWQNTAGTTGDCND